MNASARVAVVGAGAIGSLVAGRLAHAGLDVTLLARGERLSRLRAGPIAIRTPEGEVSIAIDARDDLPEASFDMLVTAVKAHSLPGLAPVLKAAAKPGAVLLPLVNGMPWWYFQDSDTPGGSVKAVDPQARLADSFAPANLVGAVVYARAALDEQGDVISQAAERFVLGPVCAGGDDATRVFAELMREGGFPVDVSDAIRREVWTKLALNLATNPLSVVSGATLESMARDPGLRAIVAGILTETFDLAERLGQRPEVDVAQLLDVCAAAGSFMTSMAQDYAKGVPLELGAIAEAVFEAAARCGHPMPMAQAIAVLAQYRARSEPLPPA